MAAHRGLRAVLPVLAAVLLGAVPSLGYAGRRASSPLEAIRAAQVVVVARVLSAPPPAPGALAELWVLEAPKGSLPSRRIRVRSEPHPSDRPMPLGCGFEPGQVELLLLNRTGDTYECVPGFRWSQVVLEAADPELVRLLQGLVEALRAESTDSREFKALLGEHVSIANREVRAGVLFELAERLHPEDAPFLRQLAMDPARQPEVRAWALAQFARVEPAAELPLASEALDPWGHPVLRQTVLQVLGDRRDPGALPVFRRALGDPSIEVRRVAVEWLLLPEGVPLLRERYAVEASAEVRMAIVRKLGSGGSEAEVDALRWILSETRDPAIEEAARLALAAAEERRAGP
jgi:HEAT repeat protein